MNGKNVLDFSYWIWKHARRVVVIVIGATVVLIGVALLVLPGPAFVVIPLGLAILATELVWARRLLKHVKDRGQDAAASMGLAKKREKTSPEPEPSRPENLRSELKHEPCRPDAKQSAPTSTGHNHA